MLASGNDTEIRLTKPHILVIDDDPTQRMVLLKHLRSKDYQVSEAKNGQQGLALAQEIRPALIICDWMMPLMDGIEVCRHLKQDPQLASIFFILLTSRGEIKDRVEGLEAGADEFLLKPLERSELIARVEAGLRLYQALQEQQTLNQELRRLNQDLENERAEGAEYVRSILPVPRQAPPSIDYQFKPSSKLGGDCFDYLWIDSQTLVIYLLDVSGHGLKSAFASLQVLKLLRSQIELLRLQTTAHHPQPLRFDCRQPQQVLETLNDLFLMEQNDYQYFTIWYGVYHQTERRLDYACGGHPPALLVLDQDPNQVRYQALQAPGLPIGLFRNSDYVSKSCLITEPSTLYLYSDGIYEIPQANGRIWGLPAFINLLTEAHQRHDTHLNAIVDQAQRMCQDDTFSDDLALLQVQFGRPEPRV